MQLGKNVKSVGTVPVRHEETLGVPDAESMPPEKFILIAVARMHKNLAKMARQQDDTSRPVDEYQPNAIYNAAQSNTTVEVQPQFDTMAEMIHSIIITGPPSTEFTLQLGDRLFTMFTDATGVKTISNVAIMLTRNDRRLLTAQSQETTPQGGAPASAIGYQNFSQQTQVVTFTGNLSGITVITVNGINVAFESGAESGPYYVPPNGVIAVTWNTTAPGWAWQPLYASSPWTLELMGFADERY